MFIPTGDKGCSSNSLSWMEASDLFVNSLYLFAFVPPLIFILTKEYSFDVTSKNSSILQFFFGKLKSSMMTKFLLLVISVNNIIEVLTCILNQPRSLR